MTQRPIPDCASLPVSKALRNTHSYFSDRHNRSMKTLSIQRPRPSIEMRMSASFSVLVKAKLVNCEPWTPFCLSSRDVNLVDLLLAAVDDAKNFASNVALQGSDGV